MKCVPLILQISNNSFNFCGPNHVVITIFAHSSQSSSAKSLQLNYFNMNLLCIAINCSIV